MVQKEILAASRRHRKFTRRSSAENFLKRSVDDELSNSIGDHWHRVGPCSGAVAGAPNRILRHVRLGSAGRPPWWSPRCPGHEANRARRRSRCQGCVQRRRRQPPRVSPGEARRQARRSRRGARYQAQGL